MSNLPVDHSVFIHPTAVPMDEIQAEICARRRYVQCAELDDYRMNEGSPTFLNFTRLNPTSVNRRITLSNGTKATYARTTSQQPVYQSNTSLMVPRTLHSTPSMFSGQAGMTISSYLFSPLTHT